MSYDIDVYGRVELTSGEMIEFAAAQGLVPDDTGGRGQSPSVLALRRADSGEYALTFAGGYRVEPEDLPPWRASELAGAGLLYRVIVEGSRAQEIPAAKELAERLATHVRGTAIDLQSEPVLLDEPTGPPAARGFLHVEWYYAAGDEKLVAKYLALARADFPQGVPHRFGTHDPLPGKVSRDGDEGLDRFYREECRASSLLIKGRQPLVRGLFSGWSEASWPSVKLTLEFGGSAAVDVRGLEKFFVEFARKTESFFACVELNDREFVSAVAQSVTGEWPGLPRVPQWLTWFTTDYGALVRPHLPEGGLQSYPDGLVHRWSDAPASADEISLGGANSPWLPERLLPTQDQPDNPRIATKPARLMPASLRAEGGTERRPFWGRLFGYPPSE